MLRLILFFCFSACSFVLLGQCELSLKIQSIKDETPVPAIISLNGEPMNGSEPNHSFSARLFCGRSYSLTISAVGYITDETRILIRRDTQMIISLQPSLSLPDVEILANRMPGNILPAVTSISASQLQAVNTGKDIPFLLESVPSVFSTSDAGNQIGYTGLRIRGSDQTRINVTINGVPVNDAESQNVFWVDLPDLASSVDQIEIQRGVGTSSYGAGSFGANINILTRKPSEVAYLTTAFSGGSFNTMKKSVLFGTGLLNKHFTLEGRWSSLNSDGYVDRATSDLESFYGNLNYIGNKSVLRLIAFSGKEKTYQSWYGVPESVLSGDPAQMNAYADRNGLSDSERNNLLNSGRTYNYYQYKDQTDNYRQNYYQLIYSYRLAKNWNLISVTHFTAGKGYYEEWKPNDALANYGLAPVVQGTDTVLTANIARRRWLDNKFYGSNMQVRYETNKLFFTGGFTAYQYDGRHFGEIIRIDNYPGLAPDSRYYNGNGEQSDRSLFSKLKFNISEQLSAFADLQYRVIDYTAKGNNNDLVAFDFNRSYKFLNPKLGLGFQNGNGLNILASIGRSNSQPFREDFINSPAGQSPRSEQLTDLEFEIQKNSVNWSASATLYHMSYKDQLVLTGALNDVGAALRSNVDQSFRQGVELQAAWKPVGFFKWSGNLSLSRNRIRDFEYVLYDYENGSTIIKNYRNTPISFSPSSVAFTDFEFLYQDFTLNITGKFVGRQFMDNTGDTGKSIDPYKLANASIVWRNTFKNGTKLQLQFQIFNLTNLKYSSNGYTYSYIYGDTVTENFFYPQAGRHFMLSCKIDW